MTCCPSPVPSASSPPAEAQCDLCGSVDPSHPSLNAPRSPDTCVSLPLTDPSLLPRHLLISPIWISLARTATRMAERHLTLDKHPQGIFGKMKDGASAWKHFWEWRQRGWGQGAAQASPLALGLPSHLDVPAVRGSSLVCLCPDRPFPLGCSINSNRGGVAGGRAGACHHPGPCHAGLMVPRITAGHQGLEGLKRVVRLQQGTEGTWGGESKAPGNPGFQCWLWSCVVVWLPKGDLSVLGWMVG